MVRGFTPMTAFSTRSASRSSSEPVPAPPLRHDCTLRFRLLRKLLPASRLESMREMGTVGGASVAAAKEGGSDIVAERFSGGTAPLNRTSGSADGVEAARARDGAEWVLVRGAAQRPSDAKALATIWVRGVGAPPLAEGEGERSLLVGERWPCHLKVGMAKQWRRWPEEMASSVLRAGVARRLPSFVAPGAPRGLLGCGGF